MKKIFTSILMVAVGAFVVPCAVSAEPINAAGDQTQNAKINEIIATDTYDIQLEWGALTYNYKKGAGDNYTWEPSSEANNFVRVVNGQSTTKITATISWGTSINGLQATMTGKFSNGTTSCAQFTGPQPFQWANNPDGNYVQSEDPNEIFYTDPACGTQVVADTPYVSGSFYKMTKHEQSFEGNKVDLDYQVESGPAQEAGWEIDLTGGSLEDVTAAQATAEKTIGTVTVNIAKYVEQS